MCHRVQLRVLTCLALVGMCCWLGQVRADDTKDAQAEEIAKLRKALEEAKIALLDQKKENAILRTKLGEVQAQLALERDLRKKSEEEFEKTQRKLVENFEKLLADSRKLVEISQKGQEEALTQVKKFRVLSEEAIQELQVRRKDAERLVELVKEREAALAKQTAENLQQKKELISAQVEAKMLLERCKQLEQRIRELEKQRGDNKPAPPVKNPPPKDVEGTVTGGSGGLVEISLGSDDGIQRGHTLEVYRLEPRPMYLGTIRIIEIREKSAICMSLDERLGKQIQPKDRVASKIPR